jgi:hypothetical protein
MKSGLFTINIRFPSLSPVITVATNVQVDHKEPVYKGIDQDDINSDSDESKGRKAGYGALDGKASRCQTEETVPQSSDHRTSQLPLYESLLENEGATRTRLRSSSEKPIRALEGDSAHKSKQGTCLQQHSAYFDRDGDGIIWPWDTYKGCRDFGWGRCMSILLQIRLRQIDTS